VNKVFTSLAVLRARTGHSEQFSFFKNEHVVRKDEEAPLNPLVDMFSHWKKKASVPMVQASLKNTYGNLFSQMEPKVDVARQQRLIEGEQKGRRDNPVTGSVHFLRTNKN
jgi:hypothetical protein